MARKLWIPLLIFLSLFPACSRLERAQSPGNGPEASALPAGQDDLPGNSFTPGKGDKSLKRGEVIIDAQTILEESGFPREYQLQVSGSLPSPCHQLQAVVDLPARNGEIDVQVYSVVDPYTVCSQVRTPFQANIPLGSYVRGSYAVYENGEKIGEITP